MLHARFLCFLYFALYAHGIPAESPCEQPNTLPCDNGRCISYLFVCDGEDDCGDNTDEANCTDFKFTLPTINCTENEYKCKDQLCIPLSKLCDGVVDCLDRSDEYPNCEKDIKCDGFRCNDGGCVKQEYVCNGIGDCADDSDEKSCIDVIPNDTCTGDDRYLCKNFQCVPFDVLCNKFDDCGDNSDETSEACEKVLVSKLQRLLEKTKHSASSGLAGWVFRSLRMESTEIRMNPVGDVSVQSQIGNGAVLDAVGVGHSNASKEEADTEEIVPEDEIQVNSLIEA